MSKPVKITLISFLVIFACMGGACSMRTTDASVSKGADPVPAAVADREIDAALATIKKKPDSTAGYNQLATVYINKARSTGDFGLNSKAQSAVDEALKIAPDDFTARKLQSSLHLTFHRFRDALYLGKKLQQEFPSDAYIYGVLTDANVELGNYAEAIVEAQKMVDLKPNTASYARVGHLRSLHGDHPGAVEMFKTAARTADPLDKEAQSWCLVRLGDEFWKNGNYTEAEKVYDEALQIFPGFHLAVAGKGRIRAAQNDFEGAERFLSDAQNKVPNAETIILLGHIYKLQGLADKAGHQYELVEAVEQKLGMKGDQKLLALFWADQNIRLDEALSIAAAEHDARKDIYTADVLAWCLFKKGRLPEAKAAITEALRLKTNDAGILYHAGMIENGLGNRTQAVILLKKALMINPSFDLIQAENARSVISILQ
ncbi:MAG: tetratricopeptide repeat protein [Blastocatellia bacterium]|nr:tetratricopeptide repeat protein [Blastocatellia bacterium]